MKLSLSDISVDSYKDGSVFVLNTTRGENRGPVVFNCPKTNGRGLDTVTVPDTYLPTDLINYVTKNQILESSDFKSAIRNRFIAIIDREEAKEIESQPGANEERIRVENDIRERDNMTHSLLGEDATPQPAQTVVGQDEKPAKESVSPKVEAILAKHESYGDVATLNSLRTIEVDLTLSDLRHIKRFAKNKRIKNVFLFAKELINKRKQSK